MKFCNHCIYILFYILVIPYGCESNKTSILESTSGGQASGGQANGGQASGGQASGGANPLSRPMCQEMNDHAGAVAACTS